ncbi:MAG: hypothetical protein J5I94_15785 [Phaeodactylibacter sp.]|nr:hypothetical protein [Phaeodactylibacter sp.]
MDLPFNEELQRRVHQGVADNSNDPDVQDINGNLVGEKILEALNSLEVGEKIASSPLIKVIEKDEETVTLLIRGRMKLAKGNFQPFMRIEASFPLDVLGLPEVRTFIADLKIKDPESTPVTEMKMGLGYDGLVFSGLGGARLLPVGFGFEIFLGGVSDRGIMLGIDVFLPAPIPLGPTGFGLNGLGGDYAHNFKPRLDFISAEEEPILSVEEDPESTEVPAAVRYVQWARSEDLDRWVAADLNETTVGIGLRAYFCDVPSTGTIILLDPLGFSVLTPGPVIILGGRGILLRQDSMTFDSYAVIDIENGSFSLGGAVTLEFPEDPKIVDVKGFFNSFISFKEPKTWFINVGTPAKPNQSKFLEVFEAKSFFEINHYRIQFGVEMAWTYKIPGLPKRINIFAKLGGGIKALVGWIPKQLAGELTLFGEAGVQILKFKLSASLSGKIRGHLPKPKILKAELEFKINTPPLIPDPKFKIEVPKEEENDPPDLTAPLLTIEDISASAHVGALHKATKQQWDITVPDDNPLNLPWPDIQIVVPFSRRVINDTDIPIDGPTDGEQSGGYQVRHRLVSLVLINQNDGTNIENLSAHWVRLKGADTAQLHILSRDPFPRIYWDEETVNDPSVGEINGNVFQNFGIGNEANMSSTWRFGKVLIVPLEDTQLSNAFDQYLPTRTIESERIAVNFNNYLEDEIAVTKIRLFFVELRYGVDTQGQIIVEIPGQPFINAFPMAFWPLDNHSYLVEYQISLAVDTAITGFEIGRFPSSDYPYPFHLYALAFHIERPPYEHCSAEVLLSPGTYELSLAGRTSAVAVDEEFDLAEPEEVLDWEDSWIFQVMAPSNVRPYLSHTTVGDNRIFGIIPDWDPTLRGIGFPVYRQYLPVVRFNVSYMSRLFESLVFQVTFEGVDEPIYSFSDTPSANSDGESSVIAPGRAYREVSGCPDEFDEEISGNVSTDEFGTAQVEILHELEDGSSTVVDEWSCYISQFNNFVEHLTLNSSRMRIFYKEGEPGEHVIPNCFNPGGSYTQSLSIGGNHMDSDISSFSKLRLGTFNPSPILDDDYPVLGALIYPDELNFPPLSWRLPNKLSKHLENDKIPASVTFARFVIDTGAQPSTNPIHPFFGYNNTVSETTVEGIADTQERLYALWLRTPEPLNWYRVSASLSIRHLEGVGPCAKKYAFRRRLELEVEILPGPDASSALIIGSFANTRIRLPRGEYELTLAFDPDIEGLPKLRPSIAIPNPEVITLKFLQLAGRNWPTPGEDIVIPSDIIGISGGVFDDRLSGSITKFFQLKNLGFKANTSESAPSIKLQRKAKKIIRPNINNQDNISPQ